MTDAPKQPPLDPKADDGKTIDEKVTGQDSAPKTGIEREDAQSSDVLAPVAPMSTGVTISQRSGMWSSGTGDTSGYGGMQRVIEMPGLAQQPFGGWYDEVYDRMNELVPGLKVNRVFVDRGEITFFVEREFLPQLARQLRDDAHLRFEICSSVSGVHYPADTGAELHAVYHLMSYTHNRRIRLEVTCPETDPHIPSIVATYPMADYHERETWDMFGIIFDGHPGLTRILMPDDWVGHPQRKDYPLGGIPIEYKGAVVPAPDQRRSYNS